MPIDTQHQETLAAVPTMQEKWERIHGRAVKAGAWPGCSLRTCISASTHGRALEVRAGLRNEVLLVARKRPHAAIFRGVGAPSHRAADLR